MNLAWILRDNAERLGDRTAIRFDGRAISYSALWDRVESISAILAAAGVGAGSRVGLSLKDHPDHIAAHFSVACLNAVIVPVDHRWSDAEKVRTSDCFDLALIVTDDDRSIERVTTIQLASAAPDNPVSLPGLDQSGDRDVLVSLSSGSTGRPKGALLTHENFYQRFVSQWKAIGYGENDRFAIVTPLYFGAGRSFAMSMLVAGGTVILGAPTLKPEGILSLLIEEKATATFLPPTQLRRLLPLYDKGAPLLAHINYLLVSGEPLYADEAAICRKKICPNLIGYYASSEGGGISVLPASDFESYGHTVGVPTWQTEVQIVDHEDNELPDATIGRLRYRGPGVSTRFLDSDGQQQASSAGGWFYPGDLAERLKSGHIVLRGRDKDVIIRGGINIYPAEIVSVLLAHPAVSECAVLGKSDPERGERVIAFVELSEEIDDESLTVYCQENLAPYKIPETFIRCQSMPRSASGKIDTGALLNEIN